MHVFAILKTRLTFFNKVKKNWIRLEIFAGQTQLLKMIYTYYTNMRTLYGDQLAQLRLRRNHFSTPATHWSDPSLVLL